MHDSLDLAALKTQIDQMKAQTERDKTWTRYIRIVLVVVVFLGFGLVFLKDTIRFRDTSLFYAALALAIPLMLVHTLYLFYVAWRNVYHYSKRIKMYAPDFVHRPTVINIVWELRFHLWLTLVMISIFILRERFVDYLEVLVALYLAPLVIGIINRRFFLWIYKGGLKRVDAALKIMPLSHRLLYQRSAFLYQTQNFVETEAIQRKLLATRTDYANPNVVLELLILSECLTHQERFDEVMPVLEAAIKISPISSLNYVGLAEWYLDHEKDIERAVELMDIALANCSPKEHVIYAAEHAISAQANALTGRTIRAKASITTALGAVDQMSAPIASELNRRVGYAYHALGDAETARNHFNRALELTPDGLHGKLARQALESLPVAIPST